MGEIARGVFEVLSGEPAGLPLAELRPRVWEIVPPAHHEPGPGSNYLGGWTTGLVKARWILKQDGVWKATEEGLVAYRRFLGEDPLKFARKWVRLYHEAMGQHRSGASSQTMAKPPAGPPPAGTGRRRSYQRPFAPHPERELRLESAAELARFALNCPGLVEQHRRALLNQAPVVVLCDATPASSPVLLPDSLAEEAGWQRVGGREGVAAGRGRVLVSLLTWAGDVLGGVALAGAVEADRATRVPGIDSGARHRQESPYRSQLEEGSRCRGTSRATMSRRVPAS